MKQLVVVLAKNPVLGLAKTRLAAEIGAVKALAVYQYLLGHTQRVVSKFKNVTVFHTPAVEAQFNWKGCENLLQPNGDLGSRMLHAFNYGFEKRFEKVIVIGTDCLELSYNELQKQFKTLGSTSMICGPAQDGGFYSIGFDKAVQHTLGDFFLHKKWSHEKVFADTIRVAENLKLEYSIGTKLSDIDNLNDLPDNLKAIIC